MSDNVYLSVPGIRENLIINFNNVTKVSSTQVVLKHNPWAGVQPRTIAADPQRYVPVHGSKKSSHRGYCGVYVGKLHTIALTFPQR